MLSACRRGGRGDAQDRVIAVAVRAGLLILAGPVEERVDLLAEGREAQEPRSAQLDVGRQRAGFDPIRS